MTTAWPAPPLSVGDLAPWFVAPTPSNAVFNFSTLSGRYVLLTFLPTGRPARAAFMQAAAALGRRIDDHNLAAFTVITDAQSIATARDRAPGMRWFLDADRAVSRLYGAIDEAGVEHPFCLLLDPSLRVLAHAPLAEYRRVFDEIERLPPVDAYAGAALHAPVLIVPRVFEPAFCRRLIDHYDAVGGTPSGVMRDVGGKTVGVMGSFKKRRDVFIDDPDFRDEIATRLARRLIPSMRRAFQFKPTRMERYLVACYDAAEGGYFRPHRDNETLGTAHRVFAVSINLNAEAFDGGDLRFPEFGQRTYRPPTGGAVVFSCSLQHEATPVTRARRYAFLPFFYDEVGAALREANLQHVDEGVVLHTR
ncbi:2OG-Fe(II) oxygenase [Phenylobacterium sp.]|uniref:2OG-Fe(II) oxygenase n=1 Tax=Phenylobacterium sp. TaxID=1871053 RepID=UPI0039831439